MSTIPQILDDFSELFFPKLCITCENRLISQEKYICVNCWFDLPETNYHHSLENKVAQLFWGRVELEQCTSFFSYKKGSKYQQLIHFIKYKGLKELGLEIGKRFGIKLKESPGFASINLLVPVPLHAKKEKSRGYNQSFWIAQGIAESLGKKVVAGNLYRKTFTSTQTRKSRFERWENVEGIFGIHDTDEFSGKHILLVDDVVTTGSTLEACAFQLLKLDGVKVSVATLAFADF